MGRSTMPPPEDADCWGEFLARLEAEEDAKGSAWSPVGWAVAAVLFVTALLSCAYAITDRSLWLWLAMLASLAIIGVMAVRALDRADRDAERKAAINQIIDAWHARPDRTGGGLSL